MKKMKIPKIKKVSNPQNILHFFSSIFLSMIQQQRQILVTKIMVDTNAERKSKAPIIVETTAPENKEPEKLI